MTATSDLAALPATASNDFGPNNPFYATSTLPFQAPPFDKIKDEHYQPAIEAGMAEQLREVEAIAGNPEPPTFDNTIVALEKTGQLLQRALAAFGGVVGANSNPTLLEIRSNIAPKLAAHEDAIQLNSKLFARIAAVYEQRGSLQLAPEALRLLEWDYTQFVHDGAGLSDGDKEELKKLNEQIAVLSEEFETKLLAATRDGAYVTTDKAALAGMSDAEIKAAAEAAKGRELDGYVVTLQNTTQQPALATLSDRRTRQSLFENSWKRTERGDSNDTRSIVVKIAQLRAQKAMLLGHPNYAAWNLIDQMAKTPEAALKFMEALVPPATARAAAEAKDIQALIDHQNGGFRLQPWDWDFYSEQVRRAKYDLDEELVKPYFELNNVLENGVFYAATQLFGITFQERNDIPVYDPTMRVFEVFNADGSSLALFYTDFFKRDNKQGGAWMGNFVEQSKLLGTKPVVVNVCNYAKPAPGEPALITSDDVRTMFHEFGHTLHGIFSDAEYPTLSGTATARDFVEFPSQFNEYWGTHPEVFRNYAKHCKTGAPMPAELMEKIKKADTFNKGYDVTELVAAAELDMHWHMLAGDAPLQNPDEFEREALEKLHLWVSYVPPRYRSTFFNHIWGGGYAAGYYAYIWTQMLADDGYEAFVEQGGLTRANGDRFRQMVLSRGNTEDLERMYVSWRGAPPTIEPMLKYRGLAPR